MLRVFSFINAYIYIGNLDRQKQVRKDSKDQKFDFFPNTHHGRHASGFFGNLVCLVDFCITVIH